GKAELLHRDLLWRARRVQSESKPHAYLVAPVGLEPVAGDQGVHLEVAGGRLRDVQDVSNNCHLRSKGVLDGGVHERLTAVFVLPWNSVEIRDVLQEPASIV